MRIVGVFIGAAGIGTLFMGDLTAEALGGAALQVALSFLLIKLSIHAP